MSDYEAVSWTYRNERWMEKLEARLNGWYTLFPEYTSEKRGLGKAATHYFKFISDTLVEWLCDYDESVWREIVFVDHRRLSNKTNS